MNKIIIYLFVLLSVRAYSQNNQLSQNAKWHISTYEQNMGCYSERIFNQYFNNDTIINGNQYFILSEVGHHYNNVSGQGSGCPTNSYSYAFTSTILVRYDQKKILTWSSATNQDEVFLDYNLNIGDTITNVGFTNVFGVNIKLPVTSIDSVLINGMYLKRFYYAGAMGPKYIIEKIGSIQGFLDTYSYDFESGSSLNCYSENQVVLYNEPSSSLNCDIALNSKEKINENLAVTLFPNPATDEFMIDFKNINQSINKMTIKNCLGQIIQEIDQPKTNFNYTISSFENGIYFVTIETESGITSKKIVKQ